MYLINKKFKGYPFAHRQPTHDGHCKLVHGHNWDFEICLKSKELDDHGFVYDFGKFKWLKEWLTENFDHTCLINTDDPQLGTFKILHEQGLLNLVEVDSCSTEGIARLVHDKIQSVLESDEDCKSRNVKIQYVLVNEDENNSAAYYAK